jgi:O-antigen biosynthesis protein
VSGPAPTVLVHVDAAGVLPADVIDTATTDYVAVLRDGARLTRDGLAALTAALARFPSDVAFGDSVEPAAHRRRGLVERPDFSPVRFSRQDDLGDLVAVRTAWARETGAAGLRALVEAADPARVLHVPAALAERDTVRVPERRDPPAPGTDEPLVSVIIPTRGSAAEIRGVRRVLVVEVVREILAHSPYRNLEFVIVADDATPQAVIDELAALPGEVRLVRWSAPFNFSAKINRGAVHARGEHLLLLNDDIEPITPDWIRTMVDLLAEPGVGMVGTVLLYDDGTVQHAGHLYEAESAGHIAHLWADGRDDALGSLAVDREVSGVSAACAILPRELFDRIGGMSALLPGNYNDADLCLKVRAAGRTIVVTPRARLFHYESKTRDATVAVPELEALRRRWRGAIEVDAYWPLTSGR